MNEITELSGLEPHLWAMLTRAAKDRKSPLRWPVLATAVRDGAPRARIVVLRDCSPTDRLLTIFTDGRSAKVDQIDENPRVSLLFFEPQAMEQIRVAGTSVVLRNGSRRDALLASVPNDRRGDYSAPQAPGTPLPSAEKGGHDRTDGTHFSVVDVEVTAMDWLSLKGMHRRAVLDLRGDGQPSAQWLMP